MLRFDGVSKVFHGTNGHAVVAIDALSFDLLPGEWVVMLGENGSGKSTIFRLVTGELVPEQGEIWFHGGRASQIPPHARSRFLTHIHQSRDMGLPKSLTVWEVIRLALETND